MESPPTCSGWSEVFASSDDSGLLLTNTFSGSMSSSSGDCQFAMELPESDGDGKSVSQDESVDFSDDACCEDYSTLKKGPSWQASKHIVPIDPPPEFQDSPPSPQSEPCRSEAVVPPLLGSDIACCFMVHWMEKFACKFVSALLEEALSISCKVAWSIHCSQECHRSEQRPPPRGLASRWSGPRLCWTPELLSFSPCHNRPGSRASLVSSRLSSSHNSLSMPAANRVDDSSFITSAMSHDLLTASDISDMYNVPFDSDIYAVPIDVVRPDEMPSRPRRPQRHHRKRRRHASSSRSDSLRPYDSRNKVSLLPRPVLVTPDLSSEGGVKRHSVPGTSTVRQPSPARTEPIHMTLHEVRQYLHNLYSSSSDSSDNRGNAKQPVMLAVKQMQNNKCQAKDTYLEHKSAPRSANGNICKNNSIRKTKKTFMINIKNKKAKDSCDFSVRDSAKLDLNGEEKDRLKKPSSKNSFSSNLKQTLCSIFRIRKLSSPDHTTTKKEVVREVEDVIVSVPSALVEEDFQEQAESPVGEVRKPPFLKRALPPLPRRVDMEGLISPLSSPGDQELIAEEPSMDFASSIEKVKDYGWYWGPISGEAAEKILSNEPDGSFIVRDSSDDHYIFSLTFKLNGVIRHVRIEHDQGNFSFGSSTKFKSHTIVDFIENAVEHSRSGRYLFFLHRRPVLGPMRVQLLHPVSRFKQVQSLQHMCRFVILKLVRRDLIPTLPLPRRLIDYLSTPHYYSEQLLEDDRGSSKGPSPSTDDVGLVSFAPQGLS
ncbi:uncharacterized protein LOC134541442 [Bacillus rossius redtenbacheri]|uniref:uncharacterized protein LOC134541442 n=1 Tax=Bacillus rossius redtenbacheri TaxID=93214 RepID=UPI002FDE7669